MTAAATHPPFDAARQRDIAHRAIARNSFCVLATSSADNRPHAVGILYSAVDWTLYFAVGENSVKVRNVRANPNVAVSIPVRKFPFGPPMAVQFQGVGEVLAADDPHVRALLGAGRLKRITSAAALDRPGACVIKVVPRRRIFTYGLGMSLIRLLRDVTQGARTVELP
jgi:hypothetical protein